MTQLDLLSQFDETAARLASGQIPRRIMRPAARRTDPEGSHDAAREVTESGERAVQASCVLELVWRWPGRTSAELARELRVHTTAKMDRQRWRYIIARRLPELGDADLVYAHALSNPGRRPYIVVVEELEPCAVSGKRVMRWWPVREPGED